MTFHRDADYLKLYKGNWRIRIKVPAECRDRLPAPHTGKLELLKSTGTGNYTHAKIIARPIISEYQAMIENARPVVVPWPKIIWNPATLIEPSPVPWPHVIWRPASQHPTSRVNSESMVDVTPEEPATKVVPFSVILDTWGKETNHRHTYDDAGNIVTYDTTRTNFGTVFDHLAKSLGHDDATKVTDQNMNDWLDKLLDSGKSHQTVKKYVTVVRRVFSVAKKRKKITTGPCADFNLTPTEAPNRTRNERFTATELVLLLAEARKATKPLLKITTLIAIYGGPRLSEIVEAHTKDFEEVDGELVFHIRLDNRPPAQRVKTNYSLRRYPLHRAIADEVRAYLRTIPEGPLFPPSMVKVDRYGKLGHNAGEQYRKWLRKLIPDLGKGDATHMFRHSFKSAGRGRLDKEVRNYITGHKDGGEAAEYGKYPIATIRDELLKLPADPREWNC
jgi:hypothetical protein